MSQPGYGDSYGGGGYGGGYGQQSSQPYNNNFQNSYVGGNQGMGMENQEMQPPSAAGQPPPPPSASSYNPQYSSAGSDWGSYSAAGVHPSSGQYRGTHPVQGNPYGVGSYSQSQGYNPGSDYGGASPPGDQGQMEVDQGSLGQMDGSSSYGGGGFESETFDEERPLLEDLGVDLNLIRLRTLSVLNPIQQVDAEALKDVDLAGPLLFCLLFGAILLLTGKVHFGYIYGVGLLGCTSLYAVLNLMSSSSVSVGCVVSTLGYCLLPMVLLSSVSIVLQLQGILGTVLSVLIIGWCSYSASKLFVTVLSMHSMQLLIAYPCALLYGVFALLTIF